MRIALQVAFLSVGIHGRHDQVQDGGRYNWIYGDTKDQTKPFNFHPEEERHSPGISRGFRSFQPEPYVMDKLGYPDYTENVLDEPLYQEIGEPLHQEIGEVTTYADFNDDDDFPRSRAYEDPFEVPILGGEKYKKRKTEQLLKLVRGVKKKGGKLGGKVVNSTKRLATRAADQGRRIRKKAARKARQLRTPSVSKRAKYTLSADAAAFD